MLKKIISLITALTLIFCVNSFAANFSDLQDDKYNWAKDTINDLADKGIIKGYSDGTYGPARQITRQEAFTLLARAIGVNDYQNSLAVELEQYEYAGTAANFNTYADKELCFMLSRGVLNAEEIKDYLADENKDKIMLRHEAAVLISKILDIRDGFDENGEYGYNFTDADKIPQQSLPAVAFVASQGILTGMEDGSFSPDTGVTRAQIALILDRIIKKLNVQYITGSITQVHDEESAVDIDGVKYALDDKVYYTVNGKSCGRTDLNIGDKATLITVSSGVWMLNAVRESSLIFETVKGTIVSQSGTTVTMLDGKTYKLSAFLNCFEKGESIKLDEMNLENPVTLDLVNGFVRKISGTGNERAYENVKILSISTLPTRKLRFEGSDGIVNELTIAVDAKITRNGYELRDLKELEVKDLAYVAAEDGIITKINSYADCNGNACAIKQIVIDEKESSILLNIGQNGERFKIEKETMFVNNDGGEITIYDLRLGDTVKPIFEDGKLNALQYGKYIPPSSFGGKITAVNVKEGIVTLDVNGETKDIILTGTTMVLRYETAAKITIEDLSVGDYIVVAGDYVNDVFVPASIVL